MKVNEEVQFRAIIKEVKAKRTASLDMEYLVGLITEDGRTMDLGKEPAESLFLITVKKIKA